jgi:hypothetical protein
MDGRRRRPRNRQASWLFWTSFLGMSLPKQPQTRADERTENLRADPRKGAIFWRRRCEVERQVTANPTTNSRNLSSGRRTPMLSSNGGGVTGDSLTVAIICGGGNSVTDFRTTSRARSMPSTTSKGSFKTEHGKIVDRMLAFWASIRIGVSFAEGESAVRLATTPARLRPATASWTNDAAQTTRFNEAAGPWPGAAANPPRIGSKVES